jgi:hypothetical protein
MKHYRISDSTKGCLNKMNVVENIGDVRFIRGYLRVDHRGIKLNSVMVHGTLGTVRFDGFSWGYAGEGVRGLLALFEKLNIPQYQRDFAEHHEWSGWEGPPREYWRINLEKPSHVAIARAVA